MVLVALVAYPLTMRALARRVQPERVEMAEIARNLLLEDGISLFHKRVIHSMIADAFDAKVAILMVFAFPVFALLRMLDHPSTRIATVEARFRERFDRLSQLHVISIVVANPAFSIILLIEIMIYGIVAAPFHMLRIWSDRTDLFGITNGAMIRSEMVLRRGDFAGLLAA